jgi:hypothetical protein
MLLPLIGAGLGGYTAYQKSGGNLGATLLGAGTGALVPGGLRLKRRIALRHTIHLQLLTPAVQLVLLVSMNY